MTSRYPSIAPDILALFAARGAAPVEVAVLQPADPFLDMAGEDLRRRIFLTESETGRRCACARNSPFPSASTISPAASATPRRYAYLGEVFRQRREGGNEFFQAGIEDLGDSDTARPTPASMADAHALLHSHCPAAT